MPNRRWWLAACLALGIGFAERTPGAQSPANRVESVTFRTAVALPGVTLTPGSYVFEVADPDHRDIVRVVNRTSNTVAFVGFAQRVERPPGRSGGEVVLEEKPPGEPPKILAWYPLTESAGYRFLYRSVGQSLNHSITKSPNHQITKSRDSHPPPTFRPRRR